MVSLLTMMVNTVTGALIYALKAFFSLLTWFLKSFLKLLKLFFVALPVTSIMFAALFCINIFLLISGYQGSGASPSIGMLLDKGSSATMGIFSELLLWWHSNVYSYHGTTAYIPLFILTILMFLPVVSVLLCISVLASYSHVLFLSVVLDAALYLLRAFAGNTFIGQAMSRYYRLFPTAGRRHYEKSYDRFLRKRNKEMEAEEKFARRQKASSFYEDEDYYGDESYDEEDYGEDYDEEYEEDYYEDEYYEDEYPADDYDEDEYPEDEYYEDDYDDPRDRRYEKEDRYDQPSSTPNSSFNFFAGCSSRESVDKKYKSLVKLYHPDNMDGDTAALQEINAQYSEAKKKFSM